MKPRILHGLALAAGVASLLSCSPDDDGGITVTPPTPTPTYTLTIGAVGGSGRVTSSDSKIDCKITNGAAATSGCNASYTSAASLTLTATGDTDQEFAAWSGDCSGASTCQVTMNKNIVASAGFVAARRVVDLDFQAPPGRDDGAALITVEGPGIYDVTQTSGIVREFRTVPVGNNTRATILVRGTLSSGSVAKVTVRGVQPNSAYTVTVVDVAARKSGNYALRTDVATAYQASLK